MTGEANRGTRGGWFVTVDGNAHVERHVRRRRRGGRVRGKYGGVLRSAAGGRGDREGGVAFGPGAHRGMLY